MHLNEHAHTHLHTLTLTHTHTHALMLQGKGPIIYSGFSQVIIIFLFPFFPLTLFTEVAQYGLSTPLRVLNLEHLHKSQFQSHVSKINPKFHWGIGSGWCFMWWNQGFERQQGTLGSKDWQNEGCEVIKLFVCAGFCFTFCLCSRWRLECSSETALTLCCQMQSQKDCTHTHTQTPFCYHLLFLTLTGFVKKNIYIFMVIG